MLKKSTSRLYNYNYSISVTFVCYSKSNHQDQGWLRAEGFNWFEEKFFKF